jgi:DNA-directed RNA polymerase specialized sigma24 family protein
LNHLVLSWIQGNYATPLVCKIDGASQRGLRRILIAHNVLVDDFRRLARNRETVLELDGLSSPELDAEQTLSGRQQARQLLDLIPAEQAAVLVAAKAQGQDYSEIARNTGRSVDAVKQIVSRALRRLRTADVLAI